MLLLGFNWGATLSDVAFMDPHADQGDTDGRVFRASWDV